MYVNSRFLQHILEFLIASQKYKEDSRTFPLQQKFSENFRMFRILIENVGKCGKVVVKWWKCMVETATST